MREVRCIGGSDFCRGLTQKGTAEAPHRIPKNGRSFIVTPPGGKIVPRHTAWAIDEAPRKHGLAT